MDKKSAGALIAAVGLAGALSVNLYSKYKLLKGEDSQDKNSKVPKEELDDFDVEEMFTQEEFDDVDVEDMFTQEELDDVDVEDMFEKESVENTTTKNKPSEDVPVSEESTDEIADVVRDILVEMTKDDDKGNSNESENHIEKEDVPSNVISIDTVEPENETEIDEKYKTMDIENPEFWKDFDNEIDDKDDKK